MATIMLIAVLPFWEAGNALRNNGSDFWKFGVDFLKFGNDFWKIPTLGISPLRHQVFFERTNAYVSPDRQSLARHFLMMGKKDFYKDVTNSYSETW